MKRKKIIIICVVAVAVFIILGIFINAPSRKITKINNHFFLSQKPMTMEEYKKGLGGRESLCRFCSMLFVFSQKGEYAFWMKEMQFNLDILWIADGKIVYIKKDFPFYSKEIVNPEVVANEVLEINAGLVDKYGFKIGDQVKNY